MLIKTVLPFISVLLNNVGEEESLRVEGLRICQMLSSPRMMREAEVQREM